MEGRPVTVMTGDKRMQIMFLYKDKQEFWILSVLMVEVALD